MPAHDHQPGLYSHQVPAAPPSQPVHCTAQEGAGTAQTLNNPRGFVFGQYGGLKHLPALDDPEAAHISRSDMADLINTAISSAGSLKACWTKSRSAGMSGPPAAQAAQQWDMACVQKRMWCRTAFLWVERRATYQHQVQNSLCCDGFTQLCGRAERKPLLTKCVWSCVACRQQPSFGTSGSCPGPAQRAQ